MNRTPLLEDNPCDVVGVNETAWAFSRLPAKIGTGGMGNGNAPTPPVRLTGPNIPKSKLVQLKQPPMPIGVRSVPGRTSEDPNATNANGAAVEPFDTCSSNTRLPTVGNVVASSCRPSQPSPWRQRPQTNPLATLESQPVRSPQVVPKACRPAIGRPCGYFSTTSRAVPARSWNGSLSRSANQTVAFAATPDRRKTGNSIRPSSSLRTNCKKCHTIVPDIRAH